MASLIFDAYVKILSKDDIYYDIISRFPMVAPKFAVEIAARSLLLNCVSKHYSEFCTEANNAEMSHCQWSKQDDRLTNDYFVNLSYEWNPEFVLCKQLHTPSGDD